MPKTENADTLTSTRARLVGAVVRDSTVTDQVIRYAVGKDGFLDLQAGQFLRYDAAFPGPEYFAQDAFVVEGPQGHTPAVDAKAPNMSDDVAEVLDTAHYEYQKFAEAKTPIDQAHALVAFHATFQDLCTWHPEYQYEHEDTQMPWQRNELD
jgi:hypothetical protein